VGGLYCRDRVVEPVRKNRRGKKRLFISGRNREEHAGIHTGIATPPVSMIISGKPRMRNNYGK
jgi:hypothetical protein